MKTERNSCLLWKEIWYYTCWEMYSEIKGIILAVLNIVTLSLAVNAAKITSHVIKLKYME